MSTGLLPRLSAEAAGGAPSRRRVRSPVLRAAASDHAAIGCLLGEVFGASADAAMKASFQDPFYEPHDRLFLRRAGRIIGHVHITHRVMQFGDQQIPVAGLNSLAIVDSCRRQGLASHLLIAAEKEMARSGALVGLLRTDIPRFFRRTGWALCGLPNTAIAGTHAVLSRLLDRGLRLSRQPRLHIRPWRRWEERGLVRVYNQNLPGSHGPLERTRAYWRWLLDRHEYDQLYVALDGPDLWDLTEQSTQIVGYMAVRGGRILELLTSRGRLKPAIELLARACGEAIEQNRHTIVLCAHAENPLMAIVDEAGGGRHMPDAVDSHVAMARLLDPVGLLNHLGATLCRRAAAAGLTGPLELGLLVDGRKYQIEISQSGARALANHIGRSYLTLNVADFTRMVLGQLDWAAVLADGRLVPSTALAQQVGEALFPPLPLWRPPLDDLTR